jgi:hypothetical protein
MDALSYLGQSVRAAVIKRNIKRRAEFRYPPWNWPHARIDKAPFFLAPMAGGFTILPRISLIIQMR